MEKILGRKEEKRILASLRASPDAEFLAVYGRRRVGKTFLIHETFKDEALYFELTGVRGAPVREQLRNFSRSLDRCFEQDLPSTPPSTWAEALDRLQAASESRWPAQGRVVCFFDELPWLASRRSGFLPALEHFWNSWASRQEGLLLIVCGSAASWMIERLLRHRGGLHNRITRRIRLLPFTLAETEAYLRHRRVRLDRKQVLELYMVMGGVPHYLRQVEPGRSAAQNIDRICFSKDGLLSDEFDQLYASLFDRPEPYVAVVRALAKKRRGMTRGELLHAAQLSSGGGASKILEVLEQAGFVASHIPFGKQSKDASYRLIDEYSLFYLTWIAKAPRSVLFSSGSDYWLQLRSQRAWQAWAGYSFEGVCLKHVLQLKQGLGIRAVGTTESAWRWRSSDPGGRGAEIDLVIDRQDQCISLCEMKHSDTPFTINKSYAAQLRRKREAFRERTGTRKTLFLVMVTTYGTRRNAYCEALIEDQLTMEDLFG